MRDGHSIHPNSSSSDLCPSSDLCSALKADSLGLKTLKQSGYTSPRHRHPPTVMSAGIVMSPSMTGVLVQYVSEQQRLKTKRKTEQGGGGVGLAL